MARTKTLVSEIGDRQQRIPGGVFAVSYRFWGDARPAVACDQPRLYPS
jgi:hypothetical protein